MDVEEAAEVLINESWQLSPEAWGDMTLEGLGAEFLQLKTAIDTVDVLERKLKIVIRARAAEAISDGEKTLEVGGIKITRSDDDPAPPLLAAAFARRVGFDAFQLVCAGWWASVTVPPGKFDHVAFDALVRSEEATVADLTDSLGEPPKPRAWSVGVAK